MKKILCFLLVLFMTVFFFTTPVNAEYPVVPPGVVVEDKPQSVTNNDTHPEAIEKNNEYERLQSLSVTDLVTPDSNSSTWYYIDGYVCFEQLTSTYCVPACVQSALKYLTGSAQSQHVIADDLNIEQNGDGYVHELPDYLNSKQDSNYYVFRGTDTHTPTMQQNLYDAVTNYDAPAIMSIAVRDDASQWGFTTEGHCISIMGARADKAYYRIADPNMTRLNPNSSPYYNKSFSLIHTAMTIHDGYGYIY